MNNKESQREFKRLHIFGVIDYWELGQTTVPKADHLERYFIKSKYDNYLNLAKKIDFSTNHEKMSQNIFLKDRFYGLFQAMHPKIFNSAIDMVISRKALSFCSKNIIDMKSRIWCMLIFNDEIIPIYIKCKLFKTVPILEEGKHNYNNKYIFRVDGTWCQRALNYFKDKEI